MPPADPRKLSKYQTNDLFRVVEASGVPVTQFKLVTRTGVEGQPQHVPVTIIRHTQSGSSFGVWKDLNPYTTNKGFQLWRVIGTWASETSLYAGHVHGGSQAVPWIELLRIVGDWAKEIKQFIADAEKQAATPDLWGELYRVKEYFTGQRQHFENTLFTASEQAAISTQIEGVKTYIKTTYQLTSEQISRVEAMLDHAEQASRRIGRKDWLLLFYGAASSLVLTDLITPQTVQHIILMTIHGLSHLFGFGGPPPHLPPGG